MIRRVSEVAVAKHTVVVLCIRGALVVVVLETGGALTPCVNEAPISSQQFQTLLRSVPHSKEGEVPMPCNPQISTPDRHQAIKRSILTLLNEPPDPEP